MDFNYITLGQNIKKYRKLAGLTQEKLASKTGFSDSHISQIENASGKPSIEAVARIANALDIGLDQLCFGELKNTNDYFIQELKQMSEGFSSKQKLLAIELTTALIDVLKKQDVINQ